MYNNLSPLLLSVLTIIDYPNNKQKFIADFQQVCRQYAVLSLVEKLPQNKQEEIRKKLQNVISGEAGKEIVFSYFSQDEYKTTLDHLAQKIFQDYIADISPKLSIEKRNEIEDYLKNNLQM